MATITSQKTASGSLTFTAADIGTTGTVDATGFVVSGPKTADGTTVLNINIDATYAYTANFKLTSSTTGDITGITVSYASHVITATIPKPSDPPTTGQIQAGDYTMSFDIA